MFKIELVYLLKIFPIFNSSPYLENFRCNLKNYSILYTAVFQQCMMTTFKHISEECSKFQMDSPWNYRNEYWLTLSFLAKQIKINEKWNYFNNLKRQSKRTFTISKEIYWAMKSLQIQRQLSLTKCWKLKKTVTANHRSKLIVGFNNVHARWWPSSLTRLTCRQTLASWKTKVWTRKLSGMTTPSIYCRSNDYFQNAPLYLTVQKTKSLMLP